MPKILRSTTRKHPKKKSRSSGLFRLQAKHLFLTWPRNTQNKEDTLAGVKAAFPDLEWAIVAEEKHQDGGEHLHAVIAMKKKVRLNGKPGLKLLDKITGKHGNYQAARNLKNTVLYVTKDGMHVSVGINVKDYLEAAARKKDTKSSVIAKKVLEGESLEEICRADPGYFMLHKRKIEDFQAWTVQKKAKLSLQPWEPLDLDEYNSESDLIVGNWLNENIGKDRSFKAKQLFIFGDANLGKTTFCMNLAKFCRIYYIPTDEDFYCDYNDDDYDLAVIDEFKSHKTIQWLNRWLDGQPMPLRRKGRNQYLKRKNLPTIILSNFCLETCFSTVALENPGKLDSLKTRLEIVDVSTPINVLYNPPCNE